MTTRQLIVLALFVILTWTGSAGIALATVELAGGGEQGPPGPQGEQGERGPTGSRGPAGTAPSDVLFQIEGQLHPSIQVATLARFWAVEAVSRLLSENVTTTHPQVQSCVDYILNFLEGSAADCGFFDVEQ